MMARAALKQAEENGLDAESIRMARKQFVASQGAALAYIGRARYDHSWNCTRYVADLFLLR